MAFSTIDKSSLYQGNVIYTGNGSTQSITGVGFQPDLNWIKCRDVTENHNLVDAVRGDSGANTGYYYFSSNLMGPSSSGSGNTLVSALDADGFSIGNNDQVNTNAQPFVSWNWKANGSGSANTDGSISSTVSVNTTAGFSIVKWTGTGATATVGHGLGVAPRMILIKRLDATTNWVVGHVSMGWTNNMYLNLTNATAADSGSFNDTAPTSSVFTLGSNAESNGSTNDIIAYCFAGIEGYSALGKYLGNGYDDGQFIYTGFKPSWLLYKHSSGAGNSWIIQDNARNIFNPNQARLLANGNNVEANEPIDFLSNGFKMRTNGGFQNGGGETYIYAAFGQPIISNGGVNATAR